MVRKVIITDVLRTPFVKAFADLKSLDAMELSVALTKPLLKQSGLMKSKKEELFVWGNVIQPVQYPNIARVVAKKSGLPDEVPAFSVNMNCASGMTSAIQGAQHIMLGKADVVVAGGGESMSSANMELPISFTHKAQKLSRAKGVARVSELVGFRPSDLKPSIPGFKDPICGLAMGETAEILAKEYNIKREEQDRFALQSHKRAVKANTSGAFKNEIVPVKIKKAVVDQDVGPRKDTTLDKLKKLKPAFDEKGTVTAGNSSPITDGAAGVVLKESQEAYSSGSKDHVMIRDFHMTGLDPKRMGLGPAYVIANLLKNNKMTIDDIDVWEINEAFAAQVLACLKALDSDKFCKKAGLRKKAGRIPEDKINRRGGAVSLGHPVGASGARLLVTAVRQLVEDKKQTAIATLCVSGGLGVGVLLEKV